jgi:hypothetical protein
MRHQRVKQVGQVDEDQHDGHAEAEALVEDVRAFGRDEAPLAVVERGRQHQRDHREHQQAGEQPARVAVEGLPAPSPRPDQDRRAETEQAVADDRAGDRRLDDLDVARAEHEQREDELGGVAEGHVQQTADRRPARSATCSVARRIQLLSGMIAAAPLMNTHKGAARHPRQRERQRMRSSGRNDASMAPS